MVVKPITLFWFCLLQSYIVVYAHCAWGAILVQYGFNRCIASYVPSRYYCCFPFFMLEPFWAKMWSIKRKRTRTVQLLPPTGHPFQYLTAERKEELYMTLSENTHDMIQLVALQLCTFLCAYTIVPHHISWKKHHASPAACNIVIRWAHTQIGRPKRKTLLQFRKFLRFFLLRRNLCCT